MYFLGFVLLFVELEFGGSEGRGWGVVGCMDGDILKGPTTEFSIRGGGVLGREVGCFAV